MRLYGWVDSKRLDKPSVRHFLADRDCKPMKLSIYFSVGRPIVPVSAAETLTVWTGLVEQNWCY